MYIKCDISSSFNFKNKKKILNLRNSIRKAKPYIDIDRSWSNTVASVSIEIDDAAKYQVSTNQQNTF